MEGEDEKEKIQWHNCVRYANTMFAHRMAVITSNVKFHNVETSVEVGAVTGCKTRERTEWSEFFAGRRVASPWTHSNESLSPSLFSCHWQTSRETVKLYSASGLSVADQQDQDITNNIIMIVTSLHKSQFMVHLAKKDLADGRWCFLHWERCY